MRGLAGPRARVAPDDALPCSGPQSVFGLTRARGNFNRLADRLARRDAIALTAEGLTASLAGNVERFTRPEARRHIE